MKHRRFRLPSLRTVWIALLLGSCAAPPLRLYTLSGPASDQTAPPLAARPTIIEVERVTLPDEIDTEDILLRDGPILRRSTKGRWASRLSLQITGLVVHDLAAERPDALVTEHAEAGPPTCRLRIRIAQFYVNANGSADLAADWAIIRQAQDNAVTIGRLRVTLHGLVASDQDVVALQKDMVRKLAASIGI